tara:strand:+ start:10970 stop:11578 length:609 start_codon:yes stop_codon:yes gene_type:complete
MDINSKLNEDSPLNNEIVTQGFVYLIGCNFKFPLPDNRFDWVVGNYVRALKFRFTAIQFLEAVDLWVAGDSPFFPKPGQLLEIWKSKNIKRINVNAEFQKIRRLINSLPGYYGSEYSRRQQENEWKEAIARHYPQGLPAPISEALESVGGWRQFKRIQGIENGSFEMGALERSFIKTAAATADNSNQTQLETQNHKRITTNG